MSQLLVDDIVNKNDTGSPGFSKGAVITGIATATGLDVADKIVHTGDTNTAVRFPAADTFAVETAGSEALRVDSSQRALIGATSNTSVASESARLQVVGGTNDSSRVSIINNGNNSGGGGIQIAKARGAGGTIVQDDDEVGHIIFAAGDGTDFASISAQISCEIDGTPGGNDVPGRLTFKTTADGAASPTERLRILSDGTVATGGLSATPGTVAAGSYIQAAANAGFFNNGYDGKFGTSSNHPVYFQVNGSSKASITSTGQFNVGSGGFVVESDGDISTNVRGHGHIELDSTGSFSSPKVKLYSNSGNAEFAGGITAGGTLDFTDSTLDLYSQTTNSSSKTFQLFSDIGGTKTEKVFIQADGSSSFSRYIESSRFTNNSALGVDIGGTEYGLAVYDGSSNLYAGVQSNGNALFDNIGNDTTLSIGDKTNSNGRLILTAKSSTLEIHSRSNHPIEFLFNTVTKASIATDGTFSDSIGPLRRLGIHAGANVNFSLTTGHTGYLSRATASGITVTVPAGTLTAGDMCSVFNASTGNINIAASGVTMYQAGTSNTGNRILAAKGLVTILCTGTNEFVISGTGLS